MTGPFVCHVAQSLFDANLYFLPIRLINAGIKLVQLHIQLLVDGE